MSYVSLLASHPMLLVYLYKLATMRDPLNLWGNKEFVNDLTSEMVCSLLLSSRAISAEYLFSIKRKRGVFMITRIFSAYKQSRCWHTWLLACASVLLASIVVFSALTPALLPERSSLAQLTAGRDENLLLS